MPLKKIAEPNERNGCPSRDHNPPNMIVLQPGLYEYTCPACGASQTFRVMGARWAAPVNVPEPPLTPMFEPKELTPPPPKPRRPWGSSWASRRAW